LAYAPAITALILVTWTSILKQ